MIDVVHAWRNAEQRGETAVLATVVAVEGSAYRRPGSRLLLTAAGSTVGAISGGCIEHDIVRRGLWLTASGHPTVVRYDASEEDEAGSGCNGVITVLLERLAPRGERHPLDVLEAVHDARRPGAIVTCFAGKQLDARCLMFPDGSVVTSSRCDDVLPLEALAKQALASGLAPGGYTAALEHRTVLVEVVGPAPALVVFGAGDDAQATAGFAKALGWDVTVTGSHAARMRPDRFPGADRVVLTSPGDPVSSIRLDGQTAVAVMSHSLSLDRTVLRTLRDVPLAYLGLLGARARTERLLAEVCGDDAVAVARLRARLHAPIGLDIGAEGPQEIALAIVAEIRAVLAERAGGRLRTRTAPLHQAQPFVLAPAPNDRTAGVLRTVLGGRR